MAKKFILIPLFLLILVSISRAEVSVGIWPARVSLNVSPFKTSFTYIFLFNPSEKDVEVSVDFKCKNCIADFKIFNHTLGKVETLPSIEVIPSRLVVLKNTLPPNSQQVILKISSHPFIKKQLKLNFLGLKIPYYSLILGEKDIKGRVEVSTLSTRTLMIVTSEVDIKLVGISSFLIILILGIILTLVSIIYMRYRKLRLPS